MALKQHPTIGCCGIDCGLLDEMAGIQDNRRKESLDKATLNLQRKYGGVVIKTGDELIAEKRFEKKEI